MSDWDFLWDMHDAGCTPKQILDAASCGYNYLEWQPVCTDSLPKGPSKSDPEVVMIFDDLVGIAESYFDRTGRYLQIWGELGELYAEIMYGLDRHEPGRAGSDGRIGNDWVEVKTISPEKKSDQVVVKRAGNFNKLLVVKIDENFKFDSQMIERKQLKKGQGKVAKYTWDTQDNDVNT